MMNHPTQIGAECLTPILYVRDLAKHKGMTIGETLEETLSHTFEPVSGIGVASPHTLRTLKYIRELKAQHGIDYDTHASYRFVERSSQAH